LLETNRIDAMRDIGKHGNLVLLDVARDPGNAPLLGLAAKLGKTASNSAVAED